MNEDLLCMVGERKNEASSKQIFPKVKLIIQEFGERDNRSSWERLVDLFGKKHRQGSWDVEAYFSEHSLLIEKNQYGSRKWFKVTHEGQVVFYFNAGFHQTSSYRRVENEGVQAYIPGKWTDILDSKYSLAKQMIDDRHKRRIESEVRSKERMLRKAYGLEDELLVPSDNVYVF